MVILAVCAYALAMICANLLVARFGPTISPVLAFVFIGLDLSLRDWLHLKIAKWQMGLMIVATGGMTYLLNPASQMIAIASTAAFTCAALIDWIVFSVIKGRWIVKANVSNVAGAAVDSLVFPTIAFGGFMPEIVALQFAAKVIGGGAWSALLAKVRA